jgi:class 3 adenylate cyclase
MAATWPTISRGQSWSSSQGRTWTSSGRPRAGLDAIQEFLTGARRAAAPSRVLATVLFTDIVASTERAARVGDRRWRELLEVHDELAGRLVEQFHGQLVKTTGDGILATFDGPGGRSAARPPSGTSWPAPASRSGRGCTAARSSCATTTSAGSRSTSPLA